MYILRVSFLFAYFTDSLLITFVQAVLAAMTGNLNFVTPNPTLAAITIALNNFMTAYANAADGSRTATAIKNQLRALLIAELRLLASYVEDIGDNDQAVLIGSGFSIYGDQPLVHCPMCLKTFAFLMNSL